ncbi:hypothetical protein Kpho02_28020 [Kitasatospora phosalacinea]|uniref:Uncharacterized protein n=1 Tax=Kitasatospora phosalacinea TaxID=2065 RepID=A0A9W6V1R2_9ACTN|nr:hypothetical protein [Kitasatospora phosalacinea]GLW70503.1 hypothetical protein Kpho02_28020 [Kitasatospora phosalacinea]
MDGWGAEVEVPCACGATAAQGVGQSVRDGRLCWDADLWCPACELSLCLDYGHEDAPAWVRGPLLEQHGPVLVRLTGPAGAGRVAVLRVVRAAWPVTLAQAADLARQLAGEGLAGTPAEAAWLCARLTGQGVAAETLPGPAGRAADWPWTLNA